MRPQLDDFINKKLEQREFEFKDAYWADALDLIEADEKGKRRGFWFLLLAGLVLLTGLGYATYAPYMQQLHHPSDENSSFVTDNTVKNINLDRPVSENNATTIENQFTSNENKTSEIASNDNTSSNQNVEISNKETQDPKPKVHTSINNSVLGVTPPTDTNGFTTKQEVAEAATPITTVTTTSSSLNPNSISDVATTDLTSKNAIQTPITAVEAARSASPTVGLEIQDIQALTSEMADLPAIVPTWEVPDNFDHLYKKNLFSAGIRAGSLMYLSLPNGQIGYTFGFAGKYKLNEKWSFNTDILYHVRRHQFNITNEANIIEYSFGRTETTQTLRPSELHSFEVPLYVSVGFGKLNESKGFDFYQTKRYHKHTLDIGVAPTFLYGTKGALEIEGSELLEKGWIKTDAYQKIYASALVGYNYHIREYFAVGIRARYAVGGIIDNQFEFPQGVDITQPDKLYFEFNAKFYLF